jgi:hypothetical protein
VKSGSGAGAYKSSTGAMIYKDWVDFTMGYAKRKNGQSAANFATAVSNMQGASITDEGGIIIVAYEPLFSGPNYSARSGVNRVTTSSFEGATITKVRFSGLTLVKRQNTGPNYAYDGPDYQIKIQASSSASASTDWSWWADSPQYTGQDSGTLDIACSITASTYLYFTITLTDWSTGPGAHWSWSISASSTTVRLWWTP